MTVFFKYIKRAVVLAAVAMLFISCGGPKTISDKKLTAIFKDVFVANAYVQSQGGINADRDSLDLYRPILASYGYTMKDFEYTLANFSKRKSVRISHVVERAIKELEDEESWLRYRGSVLDSIDARSQRLFARQIVRDSSLRATRVADTADLRITLPVVSGIYDIAYWYELDSLDKNRGLKTTYVVTDAEGRATSTSNTFLSARRRTKVEMTVIPKVGDSLLTIRFGNYPADLTTPRLRIDSLTIDYKPETGPALDSMDRLNLPYKNILDRWAP